MRAGSKWQKILTACGLIAALLLMPGCEKKEFDAAAYTQAMMDATYHDDSSKFVEQDLGKEQEAEKMHKDTVDALVEAFSDVLGAQPDEKVKAELETAVDELCKKTDYTVGEALEDNGVYKVDVGIRPIEFTSAFEGDAFNRQAEEAVKAAMQEKADITPDELNTVLLNLLLTQLKTVTQQPTYGSRETVTVQVRKNDGLYEIPASGWEKLDQHLIR